MKIRFVFAAIIAVLMTVATATEATAQYGRHGYYRGRGAYYCPPPPPPVYYAPAAAYCPPPPVVMYRRHRHYVPRPLVRYDRPRRYGYRGHCR